MKLVIQIPCYNEADTLPATIADLPKTIKGIDRIEVVVIDDGSTDGTQQVALEAGADHVLRSPVNRGLARAFSEGLDFAVRLRADIIVNTDGDNQYPGGAISDLIAPILHGEADVVIGNRDPHRLAHFSVAKRVLQYVGSAVVRGLSGTTVPDATSGFRAFSRRAALSMNVVSDFTYTLETIIQAGDKRLFVTHVDVDAVETERPSRLFRGIRSYLIKSITTLVRIYALYNPLKVFVLIGGTLLAIGTSIGARFVYFYFTDGGAGHIQSLIFAAVLMLAGFQAVLFGLMADLLAASRRMLEDALLRLRQLELRETK